MPKEDMSTAADPTYYKLVADYLKEQFKDYDSYEGVEMSSFRWVHSVKGWNWLTCVRFRDHGHQRTYVLFVKDNAIIDGRYAVQTDDCGTQTFSPFDQQTGAIAPASAGLREPLY